ncbi:hypothetical protein D3C73_1345970 [compost metagenome]
MIRARCSIRASCRLPLPKWQGGTNDEKGRERSDSRDRPDETYRGKAIRRAECEAACVDERSRATAYRLHRVHWRVGADLPAGERETVFAAEAFRHHPGGFGECR